MKQERTLILGVGNLLMKDDGVGVHAIRALERDPPPGVELADGGTAILHSIEWIDGTERLLVIDAVRAGGEPGAVGAWNGYTMERGDGRGGIHAMGVRAAIEWLPENRRPADFVVVGVEPAELDYGMDLSPVVRRALPIALAAVRRQVADWRQADVSAGRFR
jgi:hydrogenase maturation protease